MYPTRRNMLDYMTEMNRLFPRNNENDMLLSPPTPNTSLRSFNQSTMGRSSSSTDTSPDSFPDMTAHRFSSKPNEHQFEHDHLDLDSHRPQFDIQPHQYENQTMDQYERYIKPLDMQEVPFMPQQLYETPVGMRRQRPIVGRKIMTAESQSAKNFEVSHWPEPSLLHTPPHSFTEQKVNQNVYYELFPTENKEEKTMTKTSPILFTTSPKPQRMAEISRVTNMFQGMTEISPRRAEMSPRMAEMSPRMAEMSPRMAEMSPRMAEMSPRRPEISPRRPEISPRRPETSSRMTEMFPRMTSMPPRMAEMSPKPYSQRFSTPTFEEPMTQSTSAWNNAGSSKMCTFCRKNGETPLVYMTHTVKEKMGNKNVVTCPILRSHVCSTCGASGDAAHTITYCPVLRSTNNGQPLQSTTITLKNTRVKSNGRRRY